MTQALQTAADRLGIDLRTVKTVFAVEAAGEFFDGAGEVLHRFEPHHFPREHWHQLGFHPMGEAAWRTSLRLSKSHREAMFDEAQRIDVELARRAASWGAPQIMGEYHDQAGYQSAVEMVLAFRDADAQIAGFASLILARHLEGTLQRRDWRGFAGPYNGEANADEYARRLAAEYARQGGPAESVATIRCGETGERVKALQRALCAAGEAVSVDGDFGPRTFAAVRRFQAGRGLVEDGIAGARTWAELNRTETENGT